MVDNIVDKATEDFKDELFPEEVLLIVQRWRNLIRRNCVPAWKDSPNPFIRCALDNGWTVGAFMSRPDESKPYGPCNIKIANSSQKLDVRSDRINRELADRWNKCVYEPNRERVAEYKRQLVRLQGTSGDDSPECGWDRDETCVNAICPARGTRCPTVNCPGLCRYDTRRAKQ